ncbi:MAG: diguanylate cyclase [Bacteroidota bacterium]
MADLPRILVVDDSRVVRMMLIQHLKGHYEVREEADGDAAWQTLILDHSIQAVISDLHMPKVGGFELLERVRSSKLRRLQELPFILISGDETEDDRARARDIGVSDFITKGVGSAEVLLRLNHLLALSNARENLDAGREQMVQDPRSGLYTRKFVELQTAQALSHTARHGGDSSLMVLGFDGFAALGERLGSDKAIEVGNRFARMLAGKIRQEDSLGHFGAGQYAVISPGTALPYCITFAERVRQAVEVARLSVQGQSVAVTVSIGLAGVPIDHVTSAGALLELAGARMREAMQKGGNQIVSGGVSAATRSMSLQHALELLASNRSDTVRRHLADIGKQLLPLLQLMDQELALALPLAEIERRLAERETQK